MTDLQSKKSVEVVQKPGDAILYLGHNVSHYRNKFVGDWYSQLFLHYVLDNDSMREHRMIGMIQPKKTGSLKKPDLYEIGCIGKITSFNETEDGRILIILNGICRYKINSELNTDKMYRECNVQYDHFSKDIMQKSNEVNFTDLSLIMENMRTFFKKQGYIVNLKDLEKKDLSQTLNDLSMASPFSLEEKQILLESLDINVRELINLCNHHPRVNILNPSCGVGGHCIPVDPYYYIEASNNVGVGSTISPVARKINESMPRHTLRLISDYLDSRNRVAILGLSYKPNVGDTRESPVFELINLLIPRCKTVCVWDPLVPEDEQMPNDVIRFSEAEEAVVGCDITILATAHDECINLDWTKIKQLMSGEIIFDGPRKLARKEIESYGFRYKGVGLPDKENNPKV